MAALKKFERLRAFASCVFRYVIITGRAQHDPAASVGEAMVSPEVKHLTGIIDPKAFSDLLRSIETFDKYVATTLALRLTPHLFVRPGELRHMEWSEVDFKKAVWRIPAEK